MEYFLALRERWSREHPRAWVAVVGRDIVAIGADLTIAMKQARLAGHDHPFVGRLTDHALSEAAFIGLSWANSTSTFQHP